jgi:hypothetical protein
MEKKYNGGDWIKTVVNLNKADEVSLLLTVQNGINACAGIFNAHTFANTICSTSWLANLHRQSDSVS